MSHIMNEARPGPPEGPQDARHPAVTHWWGVQRNTWGRVATGLLVGIGIGICWVPAEVIGGLHLTFLPTISTAYLIGAAMRVPGGRLPRRFLLPAAGVALVVCLLLDVCSGWCVYFTQTGYREEFSLRTALALFPAYWHFSHLFAYGLAAGIAYWSSHDHGSRKPPRARPPASEALGDYSAIAAAVDENIRQTPPHKRGIPPLVLAALLLVGILALLGFGLFTRARLSVGELALNPDGETLAVTRNGFEGGLFFQNLTTGESSRKAPVAPNRIAWSPEGEELAWVLNHAGKNGAPAQAELNILASISRLRQPAVKETHKAFTSLAFDRSGQTLALGCDNGEVLLLRDIGFYDILYRLQFARGIESLAFSPTGLTMAAGLADGRIELRDPMTPRPIRSWQGHSTEVRRLRFHPQGKLLFSVGARDQAARVWDVADGTELHTYPVPMNWITDLALSPDGQMLSVSGGSFHDPGEVRLFDVGTGDVRGVFTVSENTVSAVAFTAGGETLIAGTRPPINPLSWPRHGQIYRWDVASGQKLPPLR